MPILFVVAGGAITWLVVAWSLTAPPSYALAAFLGLFCLIAIFALID
jgi:hypothetical protein